ncbi:hypothetical protein [Streptomyces sp. OV198]|uniref:hypothetical protein n=1 Tax=Streptomyces sp. OV198 TaxID=1882787 RepID=UPI00117C970C|nr:hypothetical protein [Streptomyces sp. OV198]
MTARSRGRPSAGCPPTRPTSAASCRSPHPAPPPPRERMADEQSFLALVAQQLLDRSSRNSGETANSYTLCARGATVAIPSQYNSA